MQLKEGEVVLVVAPSRQQRESLARFLEELGFEVETYATGFNNIFWDWVENRIASRGSYLSKIIAVVGWYDKSMETLGQRREIRELLAILDPMPVIFLNLDESVRGGFDLDAPGFYTNAFSYHELKTITSEVFKKMGLLTPK